MVSEAAQIREAIEETREKLEGTVRALAPERDVKRRAGRKVERAKRQSKARAGKAAHRAAAAGRPVAAVPAKVASRKRLSVPLACAVLALGTLIILSRAKKARAVKEKAAMSADLRSVLTAAFRAGLVSAAWASLRTTARALLLSR